MKSGVFFRPQSETRDCARPTSSAALLLAEAVDQHVGRFLGILQMRRVDDGALAAHWAPPAAPMQPAPPSAIVRA
jgi:hypothetical protein